MEYRVKMGGFWGALRSQLTVSRLLAYLYLSLGGITMAVPFVWMISTSFKTTSQIFAFPPEWIPSPFILGNYKLLFERLPFGRYFFNSVFVAVTSTAGQVIFASVTAYAFARLRFPGRDKIFILYLATMMIPLHVRLIPTFILMRFFRWLDTYKVLIIPGLFSAYGTFLLRQFFLGIPADLEDAAILDGCSTWGVLWKIIMPLSKPALSAYAIFAFLADWNSFIWPLIMTSSDAKRVLPVGLAMLQNQYYVEYGLLTSGAVIALVPVIIVFIAGQRYFVRGITLSGLKG